MSDYYARLHGDVPRHPARADPDGAARHHPRRPRAEAGAARRRRTRSASSRASRRRRACTCWPRRIDGCGRVRACPPTRLLAAGYLLDEHREYLAGDRAAACATGASRERVPLRRRAGSRRQDRAAAGDGRDVDAGDLRRAEGAFAARGDGERRAGRRSRAAARSPRSSSGPAAACWCRRTIPTRSPTRSSRSSPIATARPRSAAAGAEGVRQHYSVDRDGGGGRARVRGDWFGTQA